MALREQRLQVPRSAAGERLDRFLARALALPVERARALVEGRRVTIRGRPCSVHRKLFGGEEVVVTLPAPRRLAPGDAGGPDLAVLYDDADCLVVAKPASP